MKELAVTRWGIGGVEIESHVFPDNAVMEMHGDNGGANIAVLSDSSEQGGIAYAYFCGVSAAKWLDCEEED